MMAADKYVVEVKLMDLAEIQDAIYMLRTQRDELLEAAKNTRNALLDWKDLPPAKRRKIYLKLDEAILNAEKK